MRAATSSRKRGTSLNSAFHLYRPGLRQDAGPEARMQLLCGDHVYSRAEQFLQISDQSTDISSCENAPVMIVPSGFSSFW